MEEEIERLRAVLLDAGVDGARIDVIVPVIENVAYMKVKLDGARDAIKASQVAIPYDNGGGQKGIRENPLFKGYESLWKAYLAGMKIIIDEMPECAAKKEEEEKPTNMIALVKAMRTG